jgi:hypothetical protein
MKRNSTRSGVDMIFSKPQTKADIRRSEKPHFKQCVIDVRQIVETVNGFGIILTERYFFGFERAPIERLSFGVSPLRIIQCSQYFEALIDIGIIFTRYLLSDFEFAP